MNDEQRENLKDYITALRSGRYEQTTKGYLHRDGAFCALGVGCEVYRNKAQRGVWDGCYFVLPEGVYEEYLPKPVQEFYGFTSDDPNVYAAPSDSPKNPFAFEDISTLNDDFEFSLEEIADLLERTYL